MARPHCLGRIALASLGAAAHMCGLYWTNLQEIARVGPLLQPLADALEDRSIKYPDAYMQSFHGYANNRTWKSVLEQETAMQLLPALAMGMPGDKGPALRLQVLSNAVAQIKKVQGASGAAVRTIVDIGTGVGTTARVLARSYNADVIGIDLSAPMLAAAKAITEPMGERIFAPKVLKQLRLGDDTTDLAPRLAWHHARGEETGLKDRCADMVTFFFSAHEQRMDSLQEIAAEARRILKPGGVFVICDNDQQTPVLKMLRDGPKSFLRAAGAAVFEPHLEQYYRGDLIAAMSQAGYDQIQAMAVPSCTAILGIAP